jgi:hypothetical protein
VRNQLQRHLGMDKPKRCLPRRGARNQRRLHTYLNRPGANNPQHQPLGMDKPKR